MGENVSVCSKLEICEACHKSADSRPTAIRPVGESVDRYYTRNGELGDGGYSKVWRCRDKFSSTTWACKSCDKKKVPEWSFAFAEAAVLVKLQNGGASENHIVRLHEVFEDELEIHLIMELCSGGDLHTLQTGLIRFEEDAARQLFMQMVCALRHVHHHDIAHRDLKLENWLLAQAAPKYDLRLCDFGLSIELKPGQVLHQRVGSPYYVASEVLLGGYDKRADMWSLGVILYMLIGGHPPFNGITTKHILKAASEGVVSFEHDAWASASIEVQHLIRQLLSKEPGKRPTPDALIYNCAWV